MEAKKPNVMKTRNLNSTPKAAQTANFNLFKKFEIAKSKQRFLKGGDGSDDGSGEGIIIDDVVDS